MVVLYQHSKFLPALFRLFRGDKDSMFALWFAFEMLRSCIQLFKQCCKLLMFCFYNQSWQRKQPTSIGLINRLGKFECSGDRMKLRKIPVLVEAKNFATSAKPLTYVWLDTLVKNTMLMQMVLLLMSGAKTIFADIVTILMSGILYMICPNTPEEDSWRIC